jgi:type VI secretion system protein VasG
MLVVPYLPVRDEALKQIIRLKLGKIGRRLRENHKVTLRYDDALLNEVASRCTEVESGARNVDNILSNTMLPEISRELLARMAEGKEISTIAVSVGEAGAFTYDWGAAEAVAASLQPAAPEPVPAAQ